jgi:secreted PhoX family phosphatase
MIVMPLPLRYSVQPSTVKPDGFTGQYGRLQVDNREQTSSITISATDYDTIILALTEGKLIGLKDATGRELGQFMTGLSGGFDVSTFSGATTADARISFRPTKAMLEDVRAGMTFQQLAPVSIMPSITGFTFTILVSGTRYVYQNEFYYGTGTYGVIEVTGSKFSKDNMTLILEQQRAGEYLSDTFVLPALTSGTKKMSFMSPVITNSYYKFSPNTDPLVLPDFQRITVYHTDNPTKSAYIDMKVRATYD